MACYTRIVIAAIVGPLFCVSVVMSAELEKDPKVIDSAAKALIASAKQLRREYWTKNISSETKLNEKLRLYIQALEYIRSKGWTVDHRPDPSNDLGNVCLLRIRLVRFGGESTVEALE